MIYIIIINIISMTTKVINEILNQYNHKPYYSLDDYIAINDDRVGRTVMFKLANNNNEITVDFKEINRSFGNSILRSRTQNIESLNDFEKKYYAFYNDFR